MPNDRRDWEPGAQDMHGVYVHALPLCAQTPECLTQSATPPLAYPPCCYIGSWCDMCRGGSSNSPPFATVVVVSHCSRWSRWAVSSGSTWMERCPHGVFVTTETVWVTRDRPASAQQKNLGGAWQSTEPTATEGGG